MTLAVAIQMDPIENIDIDADSTFVLALEAQARSFRLYYYLPNTLSFRDGTVIAKAQTMTLRREHGNYYQLGDLEEVALASMDVILMRQDPPFDMAYITATHILEHLSDNVLVVNDPVSVRNAPEKLFVTHFAGITPPTLISSDTTEIKAFRREYKDIIIKPLYGNGGSGVFHVPPNDENFNALIEISTESSAEPLIIQRYLPEVKQGDKRVVLIDGKVAGAINRIPATGEARSNMHVGGQPEKTDLTEREQQLCDIIGPTLKEQGLIFVGIDVIGGYMTEINVTSPTGLQEINRLNRTCLEAQVWDAIERRL